MVADGAARGSDRRSEAEEYQSRVLIPHHRTGAKVQRAKAFDAVVHVAPPQCMSRPSIFILLSVANGVKLRAAPTAAPLQCVYKAEGFFGHLTITVCGYVK